MEGCSTAAAGSASDWEQWFGPFGYHEDGILAQSPRHHSELTICRVANGDQIMVRLLLWDQLEGSY